MSPLRGLRRLSLIFYYNNDTLSGLYKSVTTAFGSSPFGMVRHAHHDKIIRLQKMKSSKWLRDPSNPSTEPLKKRNHVVILSRRLTKTSWLEIQLLRRIEG